MRAVLQSLVYIVPRANSAGTSCIRVISHRPTLRDPDKDAGAGQWQRAEEKSGTDRGCKQRIVELNQ